ncbi:cytochrome c class I [Calidifontimicrobium sp. SYSU G02091]|uniref:c-type cytochrome n=1 Tax=Calidifontimicrobium sp. SYSU G02091 TaxID=2926421 RepID=UPI001F53684A|nr:cytochrome c class I [Calidifontimicrobium sp. SYSU G02091]MCI1192136.1 cytochrome c class I [Calidifontimicrobium sp. SYSU G02091]
MKRLLVAFLLTGAAASTGLLLAQTVTARSPAPAQSRPATPPALPPVSGEALAHTCAACHGTQGRLGDEAFMPLAGMPAAQFVATMRDFRSGARPSTLMGHVARGLSDDDLRTMAAYFERQSPAPGSAAALNPLRPGAPR